MCHLSMGLFAWLKLSTFKAPPSTHTRMPDHLSFVCKVPASISVYVSEILASLGNPTQRAEGPSSAFPHTPVTACHRAHLLDEPIFHVDVCIERLVVIDNLPTFDQKTVALQQRSTQQFLITLTVCSVTPEMKEEGWKEALHYSGVRTQQLRPSPCFQLQR